MRSRSSSLERYVGAVPSPFAVYRLPNALGFPGDATMLGVAHLSALAVLQARDELLLARHGVLVAAAERAGTPEKALQALDGSKAERKAIEDERGELAVQIAGELRRRDEERDSPSALGEEDVAQVRNGVSEDAQDRRLEVMQAIPGRAGRTMADLFGKPPAASREGWKSLNEFLGVVHNRQSDPRVVAATSMGTTVGSEGGVLVPQQYSSELLDAGLEDEVVRPRARVYPITQGDTRNIAGIDVGTDHTTGIYGMVSHWMGEATTNTRQKAKTRLIKLIAHKLAIFAGASNELVADGMSFEDLLGAAMKDAIGFDLDAAFLTGNGVAKPLGVLNDPASIVVAKETGQGADTLLIENIDKMYARMHPRGRSRAVWVINSDVIPQLLGLVRIAGSGGVPVPVLAQSGDTFSILTRPVVFTEKVPGLGDQGDVNFIDFSQYAIGIRKEAVVDRSNGPGWYEDETDYRVIVRVDGRGRWAAPLVPRKGGATLSWAVSLAARA